MFNTTGSTNIIYKDASLTNKNRYVNKDKILTDN